MINRKQYTQVVAKLVIIFSIEKRTMIVNSSYPGCVPACDSSHLPLFLLICLFQMTPTMHSKLISRHIVATELSMESGYLSITFPETIYLNTCRLPQLSTAQ